MISMPMPRNRMLLSTIAYDTVLKAKVIPWADRLHTWVGFAYIFDDPDIIDRLVYIVPEESGGARFRIHVCPITPEVWNEEGDIKLTFETPPDPETDHHIDTFEVSLDD